MQGKLMLWEPAKTQVSEMTPKAPKTDFVHTGRLTPDGKRVLMAYHDSPLIVWNLKADKEEGRIAMPSPVRTGAQGSPA
jgi:hypothetical protein